MLPQTNFLYSELVILTIEDDGEGFDINKANKSKENFGLTSMTNRVNSLSGHIEIDSRKGKGTTLTIEIPLLTRKEKVYDNYIVG